MLYNAVLILTQDWSSQNLKQICVPLNPAVESSHNLRNWQPPHSAIQISDRDRILTEDNLISVRGRRAAQLWPCAPNTSTDGESHDL